MGFDPETQRTAHMPGLKLDAGTFDFSNGSETADVATTLAKALGGMAVADLSATTDVQQTTMAFKIGDASNSKVTFVRGGANIFEDAKMSYLLWGF